MDNYIVGIGAANVDIHGRSKQKLIMKDSNPGYMHISLGGVTRNVCENIARIGYDVKLISAVGNDTFGLKILNESQSNGIDMSNCLKVDNCASSTYLNICDLNGDMALALSDMHIIDNLTIDYLKEKDELISNAKLITFDPCLPSNVIEYIVNTYGNIVPIFCDPVSCAYGYRVKPFVGKLHTIKPNALELAILTDCDTSSIEGIKIACQKLISLGTKRVFVSLGKDGCLYYDYQGNCIQKAFKPVEQMIDATGAGDAFMAGVEYSYVNNFSIDETLDYALSCGIIAILSEDTINCEMSLNKIQEIIKRG